MSCLSLERSERIATITLDNPPVNALSQALVADMAALTKELAGDDDLSVVIFRSKLEHFCAGADLKERARTPENAIAAVVGNISSTFQAIAELPQPVIASVNGSALGGGAELALACDFRFMTPNTRFGLAEVSLGIIPGAGGTVRLPRLVGASVAKDLIFNARIIDGEACHRLGLADRMVPTAELDESVRDYAEQLARQAPLALRAAKRAIHAARDLPLIAGLEHEGSIYKTLIPTADRLEGIAAFQAKRRPKWEGR